MRLATEPRQNPFRDALRKPEWAQLTRLAGDRASICFEELRRRVSRIAGLEEELHYSGGEWGWTPRYRVGEQTLFTVHVLPGLLEASVDLEALLREKLLESLRVAAPLKETIRNSPVRHGTARTRVRLANRADVRSFANLVLVKSKSVAAQQRS